MTKRRVNPNRLPSSDEEQSRQSISPEQRSPAVVQRLYRLYGRNARRDGRVEVAQSSGAQLNRVHGIYTAHNDIPTIEESALRSGPLPGGIESILPPEMTSGTSSTVSTPTTVIVQSLPAPQYSPGTIQSTIQSILEGLGSWIPRRNRENETESGAIAAREPAAQSYAYLSQSPSPLIYSPITPQHTTPERTTSQVDESPGLSFRGDPDSPLYGCRRPKSSHHPSSSQAQHVETQQESSPRGRPPKVPDWVRPTWAPQAGYQEPPPIDMAAPGFDYSSLPLFTHTDANKRPTRPWKVNRRRYACPICGCAIAKKENMEHHIRTHLQSNPWLCRFCPSRFKRDYDAYPHIERTHKDKAGAANLNTLANKKRLRDEEEDEDDTRNPSKKTKKSAKFRSIPNRKQSAKLIAKPAAKSSTKRAFRARPKTRQSKQRNGESTETSKSSTTESEDDNSPSCPARKKWVQIKKRAEQTAAERPVLEQIRQHGPITRRQAQLNRASKQNSENVNPSS